MIQDQVLYWELNRIGEIYVSGGGILTIVTHTLHPIHTEDTLTQGQHIQGDHIALGDILILQVEVLVGMDGMVDQVPEVLVTQEGDQEEMGGIMDPQGLQDPQGPQAPQPSQDLSLQWRCLLHLR